MNKSNYSYCYPALSKYPRSKKQAEKLLFILNFLKVKEPTDTITVNMLYKICKLLKK